MMKTIATGILTTMAMGLIGGIWGMFLEVKELQAKDKVHDFGYRTIEKKLDKIETKLDRALERRNETR